MEPLDGWRLRYTRGVSRRVNSVWANGDGGVLSLEDKLQRVEAFYAQWDAPARYHVSPLAGPAGLDATLAERGYRIDAPTCVCTAAVDAVLTHTAPADAGDLTQADAPDDGWFAVYQEVEDLSAESLAVRRDILGRVRAASTYVLVRVDGEPAATGRGVVRDGWLGAFTMATRPAFRRRGLGRGVLHALAAWGRARGATRAYLQVVEENAPAVAFYTAAGFSTVYRYHYRDAGSGGGA